MGSSRYCFPFVFFPFILFSFFLLFLFSSFTFLPSSTLPFVLLLRSSPFSVGLSWQMEIALGIYLTLRFWIFLDFQFQKLNIGIQFEEHFHICYIGLLICGFYYVVSKLSVVILLSIAIACHLWDQLLITKHSMRVQLEAFPFISPKNL